MARLPRLNIPGVPQHVVQRGNNRQACFFADKGYQFYLECLQTAAQRYGCAVHAYVLMTNHVHLLVTPQAVAGISRLLQSVGRRYVRYVNQVYRRSGTLWEGRYKASLIDSEQYLLSCYRYIELNPIRARMVEAPDDYHWSSYAWHAAGKPDPLVVDHPLYISLGERVEQRCAAYRELFRHAIDMKTETELKVSVRRDGVLGGERFKDEIEVAAAYRVRPVKMGRPRKVQEG